MKKILSLILSALLMFSVVAFADTETPAEIPVKLVVDNKIISAPTHIVNNRILIPLRALMESTNAHVVWYGETQSVTITRGSKTVIVQIGSDIMQTPEGNVTIDAPACLLNGGTTTYVPVRAICTAFGFSVEWDNISKTALVLTPDGSHYVDLYDGMTVSEFALMNGLSSEDFTLETGLDYDEFKDKLYVDFNNAISFGKLSESNGLTYEEALMFFGLDGKVVKPETPWGVAVGEMTFGTYLETISGAGAYGYTQQQAVDMLVQNYGISKEYTVDVPYKFVRTELDTKNLELIEKNNNQQAELEAQKEADLLNLPNLLKNKINFTITLDDGRKMKGELYPDLAPITVANFVKLCDENFYEGLIFHRIIDGFMIQGGGYDKDFNHKETASIKGEFYSNGVTNALKHEKGVISMARTNDPNSATSQFFIVDETSPHLDGEYAAFGKITDGLDVLDALSKLETHTSDNGMADVPNETVLIKSIKIDK